MAAAPPAGQSNFNEHPQPRTFAPSKEDVLQNLQYFFGAPVSPEKLKDYSEHRESLATNSTRARQACAHAHTRPFAVLRCHDVPLPRRLSGTEHEDPVRKGHPRTAPTLIALRGHHSRLPVACAATPSTT